MKKGKVMKREKEPIIIPDLDKIVMVKRCYGYIRVSTNQQKEDGLSLENQKRKIAA